MKHSVFGRKLGRDLNARRALLSNLASSLMAKGSLTTTLAKAKFAGPFAEKLVTAAQKNDLYLNRYLASVLTTQAFQKLTKEIAPGFKNRRGGYTRIIRLAPRRGDAAQMARLELIEMEKLPATPKINQPKSTSGSQKSKKAKPNAHSQN